MSQPSAASGSGNFPGLKAGTQVGPGRFTLVKELGRGGMGVVWLAQDTSLGEQVALKFLPPEVCHDPVALNDLRRETVRSHRLTHPNIIRIHDFHQQPDGVAFISMEYVDGFTLSGWRLQQEKQVLTWAQLAPLVKQLCAALEYAHEEGVIHRDLKPANVMVDRKGRVKLADFGIAAVVSDSVSRVSVRSSTGGTLAYMSPQQLRGQRPVVGDDVYALGATLYELLTGRPPFYTGDITHQALHEPPAPLTERLLDLGVDNPVPPEVGALVMACLVKEAEQRPASAQAVVAWVESGRSGTLDHLAFGGVGVAPDVGVARGGWAGSRNMLMLAGGILALLLSVCGLVYLLRGKSQSSRQPTASSTQGTASLPAERVWMPLDIGVACAADVISTASRKAANQFTFNGGTLASASWLRKNGYLEPGLPDDGRVSIPDSSPPGIFQVRMPPARNAILISGPEGAYPQPATVELTANDRRQYSELVILHMSCHGNGSLRVTLHYETGPETSVSIPLFDWFPAARTGPLPSDLHVAVTSHDTHRTGGKVAQMLAQKIPADPQRVIASLTLSFEALTAAKGPGAQPPARNFTSGIFAISALPSSTSPLARSTRSTNSLGMVFVPVPGTDVQFGIWETRVQDFEQFVRATGHDMGNGLVMGRADGWKTRSGFDWQKPGFPQGPTHPVVGANWADAQAFCRWLTQAEQGKGTIKAQQRYRLPTDAEWSAAVGPARFPWGNSWPPPSRSGNYGGTETIGADWPVSTWGRMTNYTDDHVFSSPVGSYAPSANGLYDLGGNVWEWCEDFYRADMNSAELKAVWKSMSNDGGGQQKRVFRGASWVDPHREILASANRLGTGDTRPDARCDTVGFRVVLASNPENTTMSSPPPAAGPTNEKWRKALAEAEQVLNNLNDRESVALVREIASRLNQPGGDSPQAQAGYTRKLEEAARDLIQHGSLESASQLNWAGWQVRHVWGVGADGPASNARRKSPGQPGPDGLVLHLRFDDTSSDGTVRDLSPAGNHGRARGAQWIAEGRVGGAYRFAITNLTDGIIMPDSDTLDVERVTLAAWIKTSDADGFWNRILDKDWRKGYNLCLGGDYNGPAARGKAIFEVNGRGIQSDSSVADGRWHHLAGTFDGNTQRLFVDGTEQRQKNNQHTAPMPKNNWDLGIGNSVVDYGTGEFLAYDGLIDEVRVYDRALSPKEIKELYKSSP